MTEQSRIRVSDESRSVINALRRDGDDQADVVARLIDEAGVEVEDVAAGVTVATWPDEQEREAVEA